MFAAARAMEKVESTRWRAVATESWFQGRGAYGGLQGAWLLDAMQGLPAAAGRAPRAITVQCCAPVLAGEVDVVAGEERVGASVAYLSARLLQGGRVVATALGTFAAARPTPVVSSAFEAPTAAPAEEIPELPRSPLFPAFTQHVDYRYALGGPPYSGHRRPHLGGWSRFLGGAPPDPSSLLALSDAWPPAMLASFRELRGIATVDWTTSFFHPLPAVSHDAWWLYESVGGPAADGYGVQTARLYAPDGRCVLEGRQTIAVLG